jgi:hypothetical protein
MNAQQVGTTIRQPSTANLMIDAEDRNFTAYPSPWDFQIVKNQSLFNGYFTRIGATEVVLEWNKPNVADNSTLEFTLSVGGVETVLLASFGDAFYTVAEVLNAAVASLNTQTTAGRFTIATLDGLTGIQDASGDITAVGGTLAGKMNFVITGSGFTFPDSPDLRPYRYLDFVSSQLTYNQSVKDATSNLRDQSVLVRWYFAFDNPTPSDQYGFPILMGYEPFYLRRIFSPPKQIAWESNMPVGQVGFQVYGNDGLIVPGTFGSWLMTLQISEN